MTSLPSLAVIVIGRNEGARLVACLASLATSGFPVIYVDSGSNDDSVAVAQKAGAQVIELSTNQPFTAARARNAGFEALRQQALPEFIQFIDGDCRVEEGWLADAVHGLEKDKNLGLITGWRREIHPERSLYNALCDFEWQRPAGDILTCGGDMMVRSTAFEGVEGFDPSVIAAEDDEFCLRLRKAGWSLRRLPQTMTHHDAAMTSFKQWWQRTVRSGHGFAQVGDMHPPYFKRERRRAQLYGAVLPFTAVAGGYFSLAFPIVVAGLYLMSYARTVRGLVKDGLARPAACRHAGLLSVSKFPNMFGMIMYLSRKARHLKMNIIEYK